MVIEKLLMDLTSEKKTLILKNNINKGCILNDMGS